MANNFFQGTVQDENVPGLRRSRGCSALKQLPVLLPCRWASDTRQAEEELSVFEASRLQSDMVEDI